MSQESGNSQTAGLLLDDEQRAVCEQLTGAQAPHGGRAQALLALDEGATQAAAADSAGLTKGQVKYWLGRFRKIGLGIFPEDLVDQARLETAPTPSGDAAEVGSEPGEEEVAPAAADVGERVKANKKKSKKAKGKSGKKKQEKAKKTKKSKKQSKKKKPKKKDKKKSKKAKGKSGKKSKKKKK